MKKRENPTPPTKWLLLLLAASLLAACQLPQATPSPELQIQIAVASTLAAIPTNTPVPIPTAYPSPTPFSLDNLFCEYNFCIGHPPDVYLIDQGSTRQPPIASTYGYGILFGYGQSLFVQMAWTLSGPSFDPQTTMRFILEENEQMLGSMDAQLLGDLNVFYQPISTITASLPFGGIASWQCGGRDFVWKVYTPQDGVAQGLLRQALEQFRCEEQ